MTNQVTAAVLILSLTGTAFGQEREPAKIRPFNEDPTVSLKISLRDPKKHNSKVEVKVEFVGHPDLAPAVRKDSLNMALRPEVTDNPVQLQSGFAVELRDHSGALMASTARDRREFRIAFPGARSDRANRKKITAGSFAVGTISIGSWFDLKPGQYSLKLRYQSFDAIASWTGPTDSNTLSFTVE